MITFLTRAVLLVAVTFVAACGGGSDDASPPSPLAAYAGNWSQACADIGDGESATLTMNLTGLTNSALTGQVTGQLYASSTTCTGTPTTVSSPISITYDGTKAIGAETAAKVTVTLAGETTKDLLLIRGGVLYGGLESSIGTDGYPDAIDLSDPLTKN